MKLIVLVCSLPFGVSSIHVREQGHRLDYSDISSSSQNICKNVADTAGGNIICNTATWFLFVVMV